jgi:hypothetical protein
VQGTGCTIQWNADADLTRQAVVVFDPPPTPPPPPPPPPILLAGELVAFDNWPTKGLKLNFQA